MGFNNGYERKKFEENWKKLRVRYAVAGMDEASIEAIYQFDLETFNSNRRFAEHTQAMPVQEFEDDGDEAGADNTALLMRFAASFSTMPQFSSGNRFSWMDEIDDPEVYNVIKHLPEKRLEILTLVAFEGYSKTEAGAKLGISQQGVSWHIGQIKKILEKLKIDL